MSHTSSLSHEACLPGPMHDVAATSYLGGRDHDHTPLDRPLGGVAKRVVDIALAVALIVVFAPILLLVALLILATMRWPIVYAHPRVGLRNQPFKCYKFRSMVKDSEAVLERHLKGSAEAAREWSEMQKLRDDPRVTFVGKLLRKSSLDELPQLINVLKGEMSCVGPRPVVADELARYGAQAPLYLSARPGITGLWQVSGRSSTDYSRRVALDGQYISSWSFWLDVKILFLTAFVLIRFEDAV